MAAIDRLRAYFEKHVGEVIDTATLRKVGNISEYGRRIRELRDREGMQIRTHKDRADLKPGQYVLESLDRVPSIAGGISQRLRNEILERNGFTCQRCGHSANDPDPYNPDRKLRLNIDHIKPESQGGTATRENLRVVCSACNQARANIEAPSESALNILARIRRAPRDVQREVYESLKHTFEKRETE